MDQSTNTLPSSTVPAVALNGLSSHGVVLDECSSQNEARPLRPGGSGYGRKFRPSMPPMLAMLAAAAGAATLMTPHEALNGVDEAEPPKPRTPRVNCWGFRGSQQFFVDEHGEAVPVRLNDPKASLKDRRKKLKAKLRGR